MIYTVKKIKPTNLFKQNAATLILAVVMLMYFYRKSF